jgi:serine protease
VLDTGVAFENHGSYRRGPDFRATTFVAGHDFVTPNSPPLDRNGHGTFVTGEIAAATNNRYGLTGLAYGATVMPVRVLDAQGYGDVITIERGMIWAVQHGAQVINLSIEFGADARSASDLPGIAYAIHYAHTHGVSVVVASGNEGTRSLGYPSRSPWVISVGATTSDECLADYSNSGNGLALGAPGGGDDTPDLSSDPHCHPFGPPGRTFYQQTLTHPDRRDYHTFGYPRDYIGTSMAAPEVSATAALVIASRVIGRHPSATAVRARLMATARDLGRSGYDDIYGAGLLNAAAATHP